MSGNGHACGDERGAGEVGEKEMSGHPLGDQKRDVRCVEIMLNAENDHRKGINVTADHCQQRIEWVGGSWRRRQDLRDFQAGFLDLRGLRPNNG